MGRQHGTGTVAAVTDDDIIAGECQQAPDGAIPLAVA